jgi:hypothetical protein
MALETDWIRIGTSGPTADGRIVAPQWLDEMADSYDPNEYTALIWPDHDRFNGNYGKVTALRADNDNKGRRALFAKLQPKPVLQTLNKNGSYLFASMEISPENFGGSGKRYLVGLGVTDEPAALAMAELKLSKESGDVGTLAEWERFSMGECHAEEEPAPGWFTRFIQTFSGRQPLAINKEDDMTEEDLKRIADSIGEGFTRISDQLAEQFDAYAKTQAERFSAQIDAQSQLEETEANGTAFVSREEFDALKRELDELKKQPVAGTKIPENAGITDGSYI